MAFKYQLELEDGTKAGDYATAIPNWKPGDTIPLGPGMSYSVVDVKEQPAAVPCGRWAAF